MPSFASLHRPRLALLGASLAALALSLTPAPAEACGGTFCDNLPEPMPVDQRGEDILFVQDGPEIEVHIRIQYTGEAERFAWVIPLQALPEVSVGSDPLFTALSQSVGPNWYTQYQYECDQWGDGGSEGGGITGDGGGTDTGTTGGPEVVFQETIGAFDVVVLEGGTAAEVIDFLDANNYAQDPDAEPILQEYLDEGFLFAAVKLTADAAVDEIHPLVFRFPGTEPCVPIRLTRIAAEEDMGIRTYFLSNARWAPSNYEHVVLNPLKHDWAIFSQLQYLDLLSLAVDEAGGQAFATEYAGPSNVVPSNQIFNPSWDETAFLEADPITAIDIIDQQGLNTHPLIRALLMEFIPPPDGVEPTDFWNDIAAYADQIDMMAWDPVAFAAALSERIIEPAMHATDLLDAWPYLTRLNTTMSPAEMTVDPMFHANADLPEVDNAQVATLANVLCGDDTIYDVDVDGQSAPVCVPANQPYPSFADMPYALRVEQIPMLGPPQVLVDNSEAIFAGHADYQAGVECISDEGGTTGGETTTGDGGTTGDGDGGSTGDGGTTGDGDGGTTGGGADDIGEDGGTGTGDPSEDLSSESSCACSSARGPGPLGLAFGLLVLGLVAPWRRRRAL